MYSAKILFLLHWTQLLAEQIFYYFEKKSGIR